MNIRTLFVCALIVGGGIEGAQAQTGAATTCNATIRIVGRVVEGAASITGVAKASASVSAYELIPAESGNPSEVIVGLQNGAVSAAADAQGLFTLNLANPLSGGQQLKIDDTNTCVLVNVLAPGDLGRIHFYFIGGEVLSRDSDFKSNSTLFLDFDVDKNWKWGGKLVKNMDGNKKDDPTAFKWAKGFGNRLLWNTFFETRLTSVPESQTPVTTVTSPTPKATTTGTGTASTDTTSNLTSFIGSRKSALMQAGNYFPILANHWLTRGSQNAMFIAPLMKVGFIAPTDDATSQTAGGVATKPLNQQNFYNYYGYGARIGHLKLADKDNIAPELLSYLDVIVGRFSNLETLVPVELKGVPQFNADGTAMTAPRRQYRIALEGVWKLPTTPFQIGFSANIGQNLLLTPRTLAAKDDLRFFFGARFDIGKVFGQLQQLK